MKVERMQKVYELGNDCPYYPADVKLKAPAKKISLPKPASDSRRLRPNYSPLNAAISRANVASRLLSILHTGDFD